MTKSIDLTVVGVTFEGRQRLLAWLAGLSGVLEARLVREPDNRYDSNAIGVQLRRTWDDREATIWQHIGYISKHLAAKFAPRMDAGMEMRVIKCVIYGGTHGKSYGASITFEYEWPMQEAS